MINIRVSEFVIQPEFRILRNLESNEIQSCTYGRENEEKKSIEKRR